VRFIEFMPFSGNPWDLGRTVPLGEILQRVRERFCGHALETLPTEANCTARRYRIADGSGTLGIIASVSNPFCDTCDPCALPPTAG